MKNINIIECIKSISDKLKVDYVIEESFDNTSGNWSYRKWASGLSECWGFSLKENANATTADAGGYRTGGFTANDFPTGLFKSTPRVQATVRAGEEIVLLAVGYRPVTATGIGTWVGYRCGSLSGNHTFRMEWHCTGYWK